MVFLRSTAVIDPEIDIRGESVVLRVPKMADCAEWISLRQASESFLRPWEPTWPVDDLTRPAFRRRIKRYVRDIREDLAYPFFIFALSDASLIGGLTLNHIKRGVNQSATLGYWIGEKFAQMGYMSDAVRSIIPFVFRELKLHRIEAACLTHNQPSIKLLKKNGFLEEGLARRYLKINGAWQDHLLFARLEEDSVL